MPKSDGQDEVVGFRSSWPRRSFRLHLQGEIESASFERRVGSGENSFDIVQLHQPVVDFATPPVHCLFPLRRQFRGRSGIEAFDEFFSAKGTCRLGEIKGFT